MNKDTDYTTWTVLREGDGGRHVHELQVALVQQGFWPGEDDMQWWQFGDATCSAVQTFQVSVPCDSFIARGLLCFSAICNSCANVSGSQAGQALHAL